MADRSDIAEIDPVLELTIGPCSLQCKGTLSTLTRRHVLEAVEVVLHGNPPTIGIDVCGLEIADADGADALLSVESMVREAGVDLHWRGLDAQFVGASSP